MAREIIVTIGVNGDVQIETKGYNGAECLKATAALEKKLGAKTRDIKTREFSEKAQSVNVAKQTGRS